jgi:hypothetical protein
MLFCTTQVASAQEISGSYCVTLHVTEEEDGAEDETIVLKMMFTPVRTGYGTVHSYLKPPDSNGPIVIGGTYQSVGTSFFMNLMVTQKVSSSEREAAMVQAAVNKSTLKGTFFSIGQEFNRSTRRWHQDYSGGSIAMKKCQ